MSRTISQPSWQAALRCLNLFFLLDTSRTPVSTSRIIYDYELGYKKGSSDQDRSKTFERDRKALERCGIHIAEIRPLDAMARDESYWELDRPRTYVSDLQDLPTTSLERLYRELCTAAQNPLWTSNKAFDDLHTRFASELAKRGDQAFLDEVGTAPKAEPDPLVALLWELFQIREQARIVYQNALGETRDHTVAVYGFFYQRERLYFAGYDKADDRVKTFRADRLREVHRGAGRYRIPAGFRIRDCAYLPFDFSSTSEAPVHASFAFSGSLSHDGLAAITKERGTVERTENGAHWIWKIEVADLDAAAAMAVQNAAAGMRPRSPAPLVQRWNTLVQKAIEANG